MNRNFARALALVLKHEGGFVNHPKDPGGATNKGITIANYRRYVKSNGTIADLKRISDADVAKVYKERYWDAVRGDELPSGIDYAVFDFAVNSGPSRSAKFLQSVLGVPQDGEIGPVTMAKARGAKPDFVVIQLCNKRLAWLKRLKTFTVFGKGWERRVNEVKAASLGMAGNQAPDPAKPNPAPTKPVTPQSQPTGGKLNVAAIVAAVSGAAYFIAKSQGWIG